MKKLYLCCFFIATLSSYGQTEIDGIMMNKKLFCLGAIYEYNSWDNYWEGTFKRENLNLGTVSTQRYSINGNYGISNKLNFIFSIPYITTKASAGTLQGQKGLQDLSLTLKYMFYEKETNKAAISFYAIGGFSFPTTNYVADYLPLSIGSKSNIGTLRVMSDYQFGNLFATASTAFVKRSNIRIDRNTYYSDQMHYTNEVNMPDAISFNFRTGYRTNRILAEAIFDSWITQKGGFDITTNNMPFPSNTMNMAKIAFNGKYYLKSIPNLSVIIGANHTISGRNVGQSNSFYGGLFYIVNFNSKAQTTQETKI
jgi:hypothetical protein